MSKQDTNPSPIYTAHPQGVDGNRKPLIGIFKDNVLVDTLNMDRIAEMYRKIAEEEK